MSIPSDDVPSPWRPSFNPWLIAVAVTLPAFMEILDSTIVNVALPYVAGSLAASYDEATYALTSYLVANSIVITIAGWLSDVIGRRRYLLACLALFTASSLLCGVSSSLAQLVLFRAMQGLFGGGLQPVQQAVILDTFTPAKRGTAFAVVAIATIVAPVLGPTLGGYLIEHADWRWIFFVNVPFGAAAILANALLVEDPPWLRERKNRGIDGLGLVLISVGLGCMQIALDRGEDDDWFGSPFIVLMATLAFVGIVGGILWLLTARKPIVNLDVFADKNFAMGCILIGVLGMILYAAAVLIAQFAQQQLGYSALLAGLILSPGSLAVVIIIVMVGQLMRILPTRSILVFGFLSIGAAMMYSSTLVPSIDYRMLVEIRVLQTVALGFVFVPISTIAYLTLPQRCRSDGAALFSMFRNVGGAIGISVTTALVTERRQANQAHLSEFMTPLNANYNRLIHGSEQTLRSLGHATNSAHELAVVHAYQDLIRQAAVLAYNNVYQYMAALAFAVVPLCLFISGGRNRGNVDGH